MKNQSLPRVLTVSLKNWLADQNRKWQIKEKGRIENELTIYNSQMHLDLQSAMAQIMVNQTISPLLMPLRSQNDLIPSGFNITCDTTFYMYSWVKKSEEKIAALALQRMIGNMNRAIQLYRQQFLAYVNQLDPYSKQEYFLNNRLLYNGFHVVDCKDDVDSVNITVSID